MADDLRPTLTQLNLVAADFDATRDFYRHLGVDLPDSPPFEDGTRHTEAAQSNGFVLELDSEVLAGSYNAGWRRSEGSRTLIGFAVATRGAVDSHHAELVEAGYESRQPPYDTFWGARYAVVADPDGNDVGIMSPLDETRRFWPPGESPEA